MFSAVTASARPLQDKDAKKKARDERFSLSKTSKGTGASSGKGTGASSGKGTGASSGKKIGSSVNNKTSSNTTNAGGISKNSRSSSGSGSGGSGSGSSSSLSHNAPVSAPAGVISDRRKMRLVDGKAALAPSGKFRKTDGYFKKKSSLRPREGKSSRVNSEFSA